MDQASRFVCPEHEEHVPNGEPVLRNSDLQSAFAQRCTYDNETLITAAVPLHP